MPQPSPQLSANGYLTPAEAAKMCHVSRFTVYGWIRTGKLPAVKLSRKVIRIDPQELQYKRDHNQWRKESVSSRRCQRAAATNGGPTPHPSAPRVVVLDAFIIETDAPSISTNGSSSATTTNGTGINLAPAEPTRPCGPTGVLRKVMGALMMRLFSPGTNGDRVCDAPQTTPVSNPEPNPSLTLAAVERAHIRRVLEQYHSNIDQAARVLGLSADTLRKKIGEMVREGITPATKEA